MEAKLDRLRRRLRRFLAGRAEGRGTGKPPVGAPPRRASELSALPGGGTEPSSGGSVYRKPEREGRLLVWRERFEDAGWRESEGPRLFGREEPPSRTGATLAASGMAPGELSFVDVETCGLGDLPVFLAGLLSFEAGGWELVQYLAPDPSAEPEMLRRTAEHLGRRPDWVSFNGRSFDIPRMRRRCRLHCVVWPESRSHSDLLHEVRRRWKGTLPDCRLVTVESRLLGLERPPRDVPGREVPERYYDFVRSGDRRWLDPVIEHNRRDVAALAALLLRLVGEEPDSSGAPGDRRGGSAGRSGAGRLTDP